ncbi:hypothetical protein Trydic_g8564 [Trypoxylus dichotomus]
MELEKDGQLPLLDVLLNKNRDDTLGHKACEPQHIEQELQHLNQALQANGYGNPQIKRAMRTRNGPPRNTNCPEIGSGQRVYLISRTLRTESAVQYKNDIQTHAAITPPATFSEGPQGSPNIDRSIQDSLSLWVSIHGHYETQHQYQAKRAQTQLSSKLSRQIRGGRTRSSERRL